uniref:Uncharacterized protein n=1 Tax=Oryza brachyantha TaxID=4533 RepID=J3LIQ1_ORYBR
MAAEEVEQQRRRRRRRRRKRRLLIVVDEKRMDLGGISTYHVFRLNLDRLFADQNDGGWAALRPFPRHLARFNTSPRQSERLDLAAVAPNMVVGVSNLKRTVLYDTAAGAEVSPSPELLYQVPGGTVPIPLGRRVYTIGYRPSWSPSGFQVLLPESDRRWRRRRWSWRALPAPPRELTSGFGSLQGWMAAGTRVWVSAKGKGTYSFDTVRLAWRKERRLGPPHMWPRPLRPRPRHLRSPLLPLRLRPTGFRHGAGGPVPPASPTWGTAPSASPGPWAGIEQDECHMLTRFAPLLIAVQVVFNNSELCLVNRNLRCYRIPATGQEAYVLQPSLGHHV